MKTLLVILIALAGGFVAGLLLSELLGVVSVLIFHNPSGIKYLPVYTALLFGIVALAIELARRGRVK